MTNTKQYFLELLSAHINKRQPIVPPSDVDWSFLFKLAKIHSVQTIVYLSIDKLSTKPIIYDELKKQFQYCVGISVKQEYEMKKVINALTEKNINHTLVKGYLIRDYYPNKEDRSFGDIDFVIDEKDRQKSDEVLKNIGFVYDDESYTKEVWVYHKESISIEVHTELIYEKLFSDFDFVSYFKNKIKNKVCIKNNTYEMTKEDHFIYIMVHLAKHFYNCGIGVRMLLDIVVYINKFSCELDMDYIFGEFEKMKLTKFASTILSICCSCFELKYNVAEKAIEDEEKIISYIVDHGVFGFNDNESEVIRTLNQKKNGIGIIRKIFPSYEYMIKYYRWFSNKGKIFLPYAWIRRWFEGFFTKKKQSLFNEKLGAAYRKSDKVDEYIKIIKMVGLN